MVEAVKTKSNPSHRAGHSATAIGKSMVIFGGSWCSNGPYTYSDSLYSLNLSSMTWLDMAGKSFGEVPKPRAQHSACLVWDRYLLIFGGITGEFIENTIHCYDTEKCLWHRVRFRGDKPEALPVEQTNFRITPSQPSSCMVDDDRLLLMGFGSSAGVYLFQMSTCTLTSISLNNLPPLVSHVMQKAADNVIVLYGGINPTSRKDSRDLYRIDIQ